MPLVLAQLEESYLINSLKDYLSVNIATPYNAEVAGGAYPQTLGIELAKPLDSDTTPVVPLIVINKPIDVRDFRSGGIGDGDGYMYSQIRLNIFPALDSFGKPSNQAESTLKKYVRYVLGTRNNLYIPFYDYSTSPATKVDVMQVIESHLVSVQGRIDPVLNIERNRFDWILTLAYMVEAFNA